MTHTILAILSYPLKMKNILWVADICLELFLYAVSKYLCSLSAVYKMESKNVWKIRQIFRVDIHGLETK